jgi:hypothetical protein
MRVETNMPKASKSPTFPIDWWFHCWISCPKVLHAEIPDKANPAEPWPAMLRVVAKLGKPWVGSVSSEFLTMNYE